VKSILLIGGAGYVGSVLASHFLKLGYKVKVLDCFVYQNQKAIQSYLGDESYQFFMGDLSNTKDLEKASKDIDSVIILGGLVGDPITKKFPEFSKLINDIGIKRCIDFFDNKNIENLVFISTCSNYGLIKDNELADEEFDLNPLSLYAEAKVNAELHLMSKKGQVNYAATVLRFATAFGLSPRMRFDLTVSEFTRDLFFGKELIVFDENTWRPYCHLRDFARLIERVITSKNEIVDFEIFNAGGDINNCTKKMIVETISKHISKSKIKFSDNGSDPRNYKVSFKKVREKLKFEPKHTIQDGIKELLEALNIGIYNDSLNCKDQYGNFTIDYS
jgi:nucleoside-diphosphate-sugar epimerase